MLIIFHLVSQVSEKQEETSCVVSEFQVCGIVRSVAFLPFQDDRKKEIIMFSSFVCEILSLSIFLKNYHHFRRCWRASNSCLTKHTFVMLQKRSAVNTTDMHEAECLGTAAAQDWRDLSYSPGDMSAAQVMMIVHVAFLFCSVNISLILMSIHPHEPAPKL
jgi:hypothetical protein